MKIMIIQDAMNPRADKVSSRANYFAIPCFYDSHLHLLGLGKYLKKNSAPKLETIRDLERYILETQSKSQYFIESFGVSSQLFENLELLNSTFDRLNLKKINYYMVANDGHQLLFHGPLLKKFNDRFRTSTSIFKDSDRPSFDKFLKASENTQSNSQTLKSQLLKAQKHLIQKGITHCRDLTSDLEQLSALSDMENSGEYQIYTETFFSNFFGHDIESLINNSKLAKDLTSNSKKLKHKGIKIFIDGTFSQNTAFCTCYNSNKSSESTPIKFTKDELASILLQASDANLEVAFHTIGDGAVHLLLETFDQIKTKFKTKVHLEHCEVINQKSMTYLVDLPSNYKSKFVFHFQPSHYDIDSKYIEEIRAMDSKLSIFAWHVLKLMNFSVHFGSDAPVTLPGLEYIFDKKNAIHHNSKTDLRSFWNYFTHPDFSQNPGTFSLFESQQLKAVYIDGIRRF